MTTKNNKVTPIVFCNIGWHLSYNGEDGEKLINGGSYVDENGTGNEIMNYFPFFETNQETGEGKTVLFGSFETKSYRGKSRQTRIEKICGCELLKKEAYAAGVTVVWCATSPRGKSCVVGWYKNATVYRYYDCILIDDDIGTWERVYNVYGAYEDAVLLPEKERYAAKWSIPRHNSRNPVPFGFGQANIWYASEPEAKDFVKQMIHNIETYDGEDAKQKDI